jgi:WD40 repeat protein
MSYSSFISYSHERDRQFGPALQRALQRFARPWHQARRRRIFLDDANMAANPDLRAEIEDALEQSSSLLLLASPPAAASQWVDREVAWWVKHRTTDRIVVVLTDGELAWRPDGSVDAQRTTVLPPSLVTAIKTEPKWVDMRWARGATAVEDNPDWNSCLADIIAAIDGRPKDELIGEHVQQARRTRRLVIATFTTLSVLLAASLVGGFVALNQRNEAQRQTLLATARQLTAEVASVRDSQPDLARQLLAQAYRMAPAEANVVGAILASTSIARVLTAPGAGGVAVSPVRRLLAVCEGAGVTIREPDSAAVLATLSDLRACTGALSFSPDDRSLAVGELGGGVRLYDVTDVTSPTLVSVVGEPERPRAAEYTGGLVNPLRGTGNEAQFIGGSSSLLAVGMENARVEIWDVGDPNSSRRLAEIPGTVLGIDVDRAGNLLAVAGDEAKLWDITDPARPHLRGMTRGNGYNLLDVGFDPSGNWLAAGGFNGSAQLWQVSDPESPVAGPVLAGGSERVDAVEFSPDGETLAVGGGDGEIDLWEIADPLRPRRGAALGGHTAKIDDLEFGVDGHTLASVSTDGPPGPQPGSNGSVRLWTVTGALRSEAVASVPDGDPSVPAFSADDKTIAHGRPTRLWALGSTDIRPRSQIETFAAGGQATAFSSDGRLLASGTPLVLWDAADTAAPRILTAGVTRQDGAELAVFQPGQPLVMISSPGGRFQLWTVADDQPIFNSELPETASRIQGAAFSPTAPVAAARSQDGSVGVWDVANPGSPGRLATVTSGDQGIESVAFTANGMLLVGDKSGVVSVWDTTDPSHPDEVATIARHSSAVSGLAAQPAGDLIASASEDGTIRLVSIADPTQPVEVATFQNGGHFDSPHVAFSHDGALLAATGSAALSLWRVSAADVIRRLCAQSAPISRTEWDRYLLDFSYDPPCA